MSKLSLFLCFSLFILCACSNIDSSAKPVYLTVLHTNDHHGRFWHNRHGEYGMAARKTLIDSIRAEVEAEGGHVLLLSGGDINTGVPESDMLDAEPDFYGMSAIGYDAMAVGNHEFDNALSVIRQQQQWSNFPFLSANIYEEATGQRVFQPYERFEVGELNVAVIGLTTHTTEYIGNQEHVAGLKFTLPESETPAIVEELEATTDMIIAVTHMGHDDLGLGDDVALAKAVDGLDLIVGGHSAEPLCMDEQGKQVQNFQPGDPCKPDYVNNTWIVQAHEWGRYVGRADFVLQNGKVQLLKYALIPVNMRSSHDETNSTEVEYVTPYIAPHQELQAALAEYKKQAGETLNTNVGYATETFHREDDSFLPNPIPLGHLMASAFLKASRADIAITNDGGIRDSIQQGEITLRDILKLAPFGNTLVYVDISGEALLQYLDAIALLPSNANNNQFAGMKFINGQLILTQTQQPIDPQATYRLATNDYIAKGGDGAPKLSSMASFVDTGVADYLIYQQFIKDLGTISPAQFTVE